MLLRGASQQLVEDVEGPLVGSLADHTSLLQKVGLCGNESRDKDNNYNQQKTCSTNRLTDVGSGDESTRIEVDADKLALHDLRLVL